MFYRRVVFWGIALLGIGVALAAFGLFAHNQIRTPVRLSPLEARQQLQAPTPIILTGRIRADRALYNIAANTDVRRRPEMLRSYSPQGGVPLFGPEGIPPENWSALVGSYVSVQATPRPQLLHFDLQSGPFYNPFTRRLLFVQLDRASLWALTKGRGLVSGVDLFRDDADLAWLASGVLKGHLHRLRDYRTEQFAYADIKRLYESAGLPGAGALPDGWLIVQAATGRPLLSGSAWHVYMPVEGTSDAIWAQLPLGADPLQLGSELRGVWLPPGTHAFRPNSASEHAALVLAHPDAIEKFIHEAWFRGPSGVALMSGAAFGFVSAVLLALGLTARARPIWRAAVPTFVAASAAIGLAIFFNPGPGESTPRDVVLVVASWAPILAIWIAIIWYRRKRCRDAGLLAYREPAFAWWGGSEARQRATANRLSDRALFWAHFLPEHRSEAKAVVRSTLKARGYAEQDIDLWTPSPSEVTVPPAVEKAMPLKRYKTLVSARRWCFYVYLGLAIVVSSIAIALMFAAMTSDRVDFRSSSAVLGLVLMGFAGLFSFPLRNRALRMLLLRPFGEKKMTKALRRFVCRHAGRRGNVFTLSDRNFKPSILATLLWRASSEGLTTIAMLAMGPFLRASKRVASVKNERKFRKLERHLLRKASPSFWSFVNGNQAFNIRSSDAWWQTCIHMLMHSCEVIIVDLSKVKEGTAWELEQLRVRNLLAKCLFVVSEAHAGEVEPLMARHLPGIEPPIHVYRANGELVDTKQFDAEFYRIAETGLANWGRSAVSPAFAERLAPA